MKNILIIQYFYRPIISNQSFRYDRILENFDEGVNVDILTSSHHGIPKYEKDGNISIYRVNSRFLMKKINYETKNVSQIVEGKTSTVKKVIKAVMRFLMWPDFAFMWIPKAYKKGKKLVNNKEYDMVYTVSFPFSSHLIGFLLKKKYKKIKWTVDYIDPFSIINSDENPANNVRMYKWLNHWIENRVNRLADRIFMLEEAYNRFSNIFPTYNSKITVIPPMLGIEREKYESISPHTFTNSGTNIVYTGTFYKSIRNPEKFLLMFEELLLLDSKIYLHFIGDLKDCKDVIEKFSNRYPDNIFIYGKLSREETMKYLKGSDILLNISNKSFAQLPGKVVEYLYTGKRILNFSHSSNSNSSIFFKKYCSEKQVLEVNENSFDLKDVLKVIKSHEEVSNVDIRKFLPENIARLYL